MRRYPIMRIMVLVALMLARVHVNDFVAQGRVKRENMPAETPFRTGPQSLNRFYASSRCRPPVHPTRSKPRRGPDGSRSRTWSSRTGSSAQA